MLRNIRYTLLFLGWMGLVTFLSLASLQDFGPEESLIPIPQFDKVVHFSFYLGASVLGVLMLWERSKGAWALKRAILISVLFSVCYGTVIEILQYALAWGRDGNVWDAMANSLGALLGGFLSTVISKRLPLNWKN